MFLSGRKPSPVSAFNTSAAACAEPLLLLLPAAPSAHPTVIPPFGFPPPLPRIQSSGLPRDVGRQGAGAGAEGRGHCLRHNARGQREDSTPVSSERRRRGKKTVTVSACIAVPLCAFHLLECIQRPIHPQLHACSHTILRHFFDESRCHVNGGFELNSQRRNLVWGRDLKGSDKARADWSVYAYNLAPA